MTAKQTGPEIAGLALHYDQVMIAPQMNSCYTAQVSTE